MSEQPEQLSTISRKRRRKGERGQSLVEFALVLPVFLILVMGIVDFGMALRAYITVTNSAREGARIGIVCPSSDDVIRDRVHDYSNKLVAKADVAVTWDGGTRCASERFVEVKASHDYNFITPLGSLIKLSGNDHLHLASTTRMRIE